MPPPLLSLSSALVWVIPALAAPPTVLKTSPEHGQAGVDAQLTRQIVARFDTPMRAGSHSWVGGGPMFPKIRGQPGWPDPQTAVLPVTLEPDHDYVLSLNGGDYHNFRSARGEPLEPHQIAFSTRAMPTTPEINRAALDALRDAVLHHYSYRDRLGVDWDAHLDALKADIVASDSTLRLATRLADALAPAQDIHIGVHLDPWTFGTHRARPEPNFSGRVLSHAIPGLTKHSDAVLSARLDEHTGYLLVTTWGADTEPGAVAKAALGDLLDVDRLIIDVRPNAGGDELQARTLAACFVSEPVVYATNTSIDPDRPGEFLGPYDRVLEPEAVTDRFEGEVVVLMGKQCMSSNEAFLLMMRAAGAALVGRASFGASGNPRSYDLGQGIRVTLPSWRAMTSEGDPFEGVGIQPDIEVAHAPRAGGRRDPVLEAGLRAFEARNP